VSIFDAQKTHTILVLIMLLGWMEVVGHESTINGESGVCCVGDERVAEVAGWELGIQEWVQFVKVVALQLGVFLWQSLVGFQYHCGAWDARKSGCNAGCQVGNHSSQAINSLNDWSKGIMYPVGCRLFKWLVVVGMLVVGNSQQFSAPGSTRVSASWGYHMLIFMVDAG